MKEGAQVTYNTGSEKADYCALVNGKNSYGGYTGFRPFRAVIIRNAKGEYDNGTIIRIEEDEIGSDPWIAREFNKKMRAFCQQAGYADFNQAN